MISNLSVAGLKKVGVVTGLVLVLLVAPFCFGQQLTGTLSGTVYDQSGAVIPNAQLQMKNEASGDVRTTVANGSGFFTITAVQPGSYTVTVSAKGFKSWQEHSIVFSQGDNRTLPNINLAVGGTGPETVQVVAGADAVVPVDTAEVSTTEVDTVEGSRQR